MKILLAAVNAKYIHTSLAIRDLKAFAEAKLLHNALRNPEGQTQQGQCFAKDICIELAEYTINQPVDQVLSDLYRRHPDVLAFSCYIWNMEYVSALLQDLERILPEAELWLGGPEVSFDAVSELKKYPMLRGIMAGEGEITFTRLVQAYAGAYTEAHAQTREGTLASLLQKVTGIVYRAGCLSGEEKRYRGDGTFEDMDSIDSICVNPSSEPVNLDELLFFYRGEERDASGVSLDSGTYAHRIIYYESSRGCPFHCSYCLSSVEGKVRFRSLPLVLDDLQFFLDAKVPQVKFVDRTFNCNHAHAMGIWRYLKEHDNGITNFHFEIAGDLLTEEEIGFLSGLRPGQVQFEIGVQSANEDTLQSICRPQNLDHLKEIVAEINRGHNIHQHLDLIAGLPQENYESFARSFDVVYRMHPQQLQMGFLKLLKGSPLHRDAGKFGIVCHARAPYEVIRTNWLSYGEVLQLKDIEEMVEVYYNSCQFVCTMQALVENAESPFGLYSALASYYRSHDLMERSIARPKQFEILRKFAWETDPEHGALYQELLLLDLYLRENSRSRPAWAPDLKDFRDIFYRYVQDARI
ncbi:MAG: DUF4080 domain-containing protein [Bilifractor sp.]